jgi:hypothetical protein
MVPPSIEPESLACLAVGAINQSSNTAVVLISNESVMTGYSHDSSYGSPIALMFAG